MTRKPLSPVIPSYMLMLFLISVFDGCEAGRHERRLINDLFLHYNKFERPVINESDPVLLYFGVRLAQKK
jgi:hypothetical protein